MSAESEPTSSIEDTALWWLVRVQSGNFSQNEQSELAKWCASDPRHAKAWDEAKKIWDHSEAGTVVVGKREVKARRRKKTARIITGIAGIAIALGLTFLLISSSDPQQEVASSKSIEVSKINEEIVRTEKGVRRKLRLSDGTSVELDTDTQLSIQFTGSERRIVLTRGRAFFSVSKNATKSFRVAAGNGVTTDISTEFSVQHLSTGIRVATYEGLVEVAVAQKIQKVKEGEWLVYDAVMMNELQTFDTNEETAWRNGKLVLRNKTLSEAMNEFKRYHDLTVTWENSKIEGLRVTGTFDLDHVSNFARAVEDILPVKIVQNGTSLHFKTN